MSSDLILPVSIGSVTLENNIICAPMAGITNFPNRSILEMYKPGLMFTEMVSINALSFKGKKTVGMLEHLEKHKVPVGIQVFGSDEEYFNKAVLFIEEKFNPAIIDINMACPAKRVIRSNNGASMMRDEDKSAKIVECLVKKLKTPLTAKLRIGFDSDSLNIKSMAKKLEAAGIAAITVHGRTAKQMYSGQSDPQLIFECAEELNVPVFYSGDLFSMEYCQEILSQGKVAGLMLARGLLGSPWLIEEVIHGKHVTMSQKEIGDILLKQFDLFIQYLGEYKGFTEMKKHLGWYSKGLTSGKEFRRVVNYETSIEEQKKNIIDFFYHNKLKTPVKPERK
ncbi:MAG: tRNA-dihydrouridine synthase [Nitrospinae bacterium]|nr:tRNA-dihydrouridine synthase [Nitrospinota bacterium]